MIHHAVLLLLAGIIVNSFARARRAIRQSEDIVDKMRAGASLMPLHLYDEPS